MIKNPSHADLNYMITKKNLSIMLAINKFDHPTIPYLINKPITNGIMIKCLLFIQEFDMTILNHSYEG